VETCLCLGEREREVVESPFTSHEKGKIIDPKGMDTNGPVFAERDSVLFSVPIVS